MGQGGCELSSEDFVKIIIIIFYFIFFGGGLRGGGGRGRGVVKVDVNGKV